MFNLRLVNKKTTISADSSSFSEDASSFIRQCLEEAGTNKKIAVTAELLAEEMMVSLIQHASSKDLRIQVKKTLGDAVITMSMPGEKYDLYDSETKLDIETDDKEAEDVIRSIILRSHGENLKYTNRHGINRVIIKAEQAKRSMIKSTIIAIVLAFIFSAFLKTFLPESFTLDVSTYLLTPFNTMFMNALTMIIAPVVFFSLVTCVSQFKDLSELGRLGARVLGTYAATTVIAITIATFIFFLIKPGTFGAALNSGMNALPFDINTDVDTSILSTIVNIVPSNFIQAFLESDTLQIMFLAILCGIAVGMIGSYSAILTELFQALNSLFLTITSIIARLIPIAVFCSLTLTIINTGLSAMFSILSLVVAHVSAITLMLVAYGSLILFVGRLNPITFFQKAKTSMLTSALIMSSSASIPTTINTCTEKLGVSSKIANFSIPLGATINMDGTTIYLTLTSLFLARLYGVNVTPTTVLTMAFTIMLLSMGAPGVPGSGYVCLSVILTQLGVPISAIGLIIAIGAFTDMTDTMSNVTGDMAASVIAAKAEGLLDIDTYNS